jgi:TRAP transporter T-component
MKFRLLFCSLLLCSCISRIILDGTLESTRTAAKAFDTLSDLEVAKEGAGSSIVQIEGMLSLAPDSEDALYLLTQSWTGYASAFIEDKWELAYDRGDDDEEAYQARRAAEAYTRAIAFGTALLERKKPGFVQAQKNDETIKQYLKRYTAKTDAEPLLWLGLSWLSRGSVASERSDIVAELFIGVALLERSVELDESLAFANGLTALAAYHARSPDAELALSKELFEKALRITERKALMIHVIYAQNFACQSHNQVLYTSLLNDVLQAGDVLPAQRLENTIAKRKAERYLKAPRLKRCGFEGK